MDILKKVKIISNNVSMNKIINTFLLAGDKLLSEILLRQRRLTFSAGGSFTKNRRIQQQETRRFKVYLSKRTK